MLSYAYAFDKELAMIRHVVDQLGGVAAIARLLGVSQPAVSQWLRDGRLPPARAVQIEAITGGRFRAADLLEFTIIKTEIDLKTKIETEERAADDGL
jgi:DNA-binding transcriptional regulator YdaS (Cro superfamily)